MAKLEGSFVKMKKLVAMVLAVLFLATSPMRIMADTETDAKMREALTESQYFVYSLDKMLLNNNYCMNVTVIDDDYFDNKTKFSLIDVFTLNNLGVAFFGNYEEKYYRQVISKCVMADMNDIVDTEIMNSYTQKKASNIIKETSEKQDKILEGIVDNIDVLQDCTAAMGLMDALAKYSDCQLRALELVQKYSEDPKIISAANGVIKMAKSKDMQQYLQNFADQMVLELQNKVIGDSVEALVSLIPGGAAAMEYVAFGEMLAGGKCEDEITELYYLNLQNAVYSAMYNIEGKYPNYFQADYSQEDMYALKDLGILYLKCGSLGFEYHYPEQAKACKKALLDLQKMEVPEEKKETDVVETVILKDYNVPTNLSVGDYYVVYGTVSSQQDLDEVTIAIEGDNGKLVKSAKAGGCSFDLHTLDQEMTINLLPAGAYTYSVYAKTVDGVTHMLCAKPFSIKEEDHEYIITNYHLPHPMNQGAVFSVTGIVTSRDPMSCVSVKIFDDFGTYRTGGEANINSTSYNLSDLDASVEFQILPPGVYHYVVSAENVTSGEVLVDQT